MKSAFDKESTVFPETNTMGEVSYTGGGLTKREFFAGLIAQALANNFKFFDAERAAITAVAYADALIKKLETTDTEVLIEKLGEKNV
jgi:hypothetical protein